MLVTTRDESGRVNLNLPSNSIEGVGPVAEVKLSWRESGGKLLQQSFRGKEHESNGFKTEIKPFSNWASFSLIAFNEYFSSSSYMLGSY